MMKRRSDSYQDFANRILDEIKLDENYDSKKRYIEEFREMAAELGIDFDKLLASKPAEEAIPLLLDKYGEVFGYEKFRAKFAALE